MTWVHPQIFAAGGNHIPSAWADFADQTGVTAVLALAPGRPAAFEGPPPERFLWMGVDEEAQATPDDRLLAALFLDQCVREGRKVLLHAERTRHRTRWAYVAYRLFAGRSLRAALREAAERPWLAPYPTDEEAWQAFCSMLPSRHVADADRST